MEHINAEKYRYPPTYILYIVHAIRDFRTPVVPAYAHYGGCVHRANTMANTNRRAAVTHPCFSRCNDIKPLSQHAQALPGTARCRGPGAFAVRGARSNCQSTNERPYRAPYAVLCAKKQEPTGKPETQCHSINTNLVTNYCIAPQDRPRPWGVPRYNPARLNFLLRHVRHPFIAVVRLASCFQYRS